MTMSKNRAEELKKQIVDLKKRWPAHSIPATMMEQLDELEEELKMKRMRKLSSKQEQILL